MQMLFTTGHIAKICQVAPRTVSKWVDSGLLKGYRVPGSQARRVRREDLIEFLKEHGMPLGELEDEARPKILLVGVDTKTGDGIKTILGEDYRIISEPCGFSAGVKVNSLRPNCIIVDLLIERKEALRLVQSLRKREQYADTPILGLLSSAETHPDVSHACFTETFRRPFDTALLAERIRRFVHRQPSVFS